MLLLLRSPFFGVACGPVICFPHCTHLLQSAQLRLRRTVCQCVLSACFRTPRLSLGHPGSLTSVHDLKCMRTQTAPLFNAPRGRRGNRAQVPFPRIHPVTWTGRTNDPRIMSPTRYPLDHRGPIILINCCYRITGCYETRH